MVWCVLIVLVLLLALCTVAGGFAAYLSLRLVGVDCCFGIYL